MREASSEQAKVMEQIWVDCCQESCQRINHSIFKIWFHQTPPLCWEENLVEWLECQLHVT